MTEIEMNGLKKGDMVKPCGEHRIFVVTGNYGDHVTAVASVEITSAIEWDLIVKTWPKVSGDMRMLQEPKHGLPSHYVTILKEKTGWRSCVKEWDGSSYFTLHDGRKTEIKSYNEVIEEMLMIAEREGLKFHIPDYETLDSLRKNALERI